MRKLIFSALAAVALLASSNAFAGSAPNLATAQDTTQALIENSGSRNFEGYRLTIAEDGTALVAQAGSSVVRHLDPTVVARFFNDLRAAGRLDALPVLECFWGAGQVPTPPYGSDTTITWHGVTSQDLTCPILDPTAGYPTLRALAADVKTLTLAADAKEMPRHPMP